MFDCDCCYAGQQENNARFQVDEVPGQNSGVLSYTHFLVLVIANHQGTYPSHPDLGYSSPSYITEIPSLKKSDYMRHSMYSDHWAVHLDCGVGRARV